MTNTNIKRTVGYILFACAILFAGVISLENINKPITDDELHIELSAETLFLYHRAYYILEEQFIAKPVGFNNNPSGELLKKNFSIYGHHTYFYILLIVYMFSLFGVSPVISRVVGISCGLWSIILVYAIVRNCVTGSRDKKIFLAGITAFIYAINPLIINAMNIIHIDASVLVPIIIIMVWSTVSFLKHGTTAAFFAIILSVAVAFWCRLSTPFLVSGIIICSLILIKSDTNLKIKTVFAIALGFILFLATWYLYCRNADINFMAPFQYTFNNRILWYNPSYLLRVARSLFWFGLWLGVFFFWFVGLTAIEVVKFFRERHSINPEHLLFITGFIIMFFYTLYLGVPFGFPRYQIPGLPLLFAGSMIILTDNKKDNSSWLCVLFVTIFAFLVQFFCIGDVLLAGRYTFKNALIGLAQESPLRILLSTTVNMAAGIIAIILLLILFRRRKLLSINVILFSLLLGTTFGVTALQIKAPYSTTYYYGMRGCNDVVDYVNKHLRPDENIVAPAEITYYLNYPGKKYYAHMFWDNADCIIESLKDSSTSIFIYSPVLSPKEDVKIYSENKTINMLLNNNFERHVIGSYLIYKRKVF